MPSGSLDRRMSSTSAALGVAIPRHVSAARTRECTTCCGLPSWRAGSAWSAIVLAISAPSAGPAAITQARIGFPRGPALRTELRVQSPRTMIDPIVFPGQPGLSHDHTFIGNFSVDSGTTQTSVLGGRTSCEFEADSSAYCGADAFRRASRDHPDSPGSCTTSNAQRRMSVPHPAGLKMIAGNAAARRPQPNEIAAWSCGELGARAALLLSSPRAPGIISCRYSITFPSCWNGTTVRQSGSQASYGVRVRRKVPCLASCRAADPCSDSPLPRSSAVRPRSPPAGSGFTPTS